MPYMDNVIAFTLAATVLTLTPGLDTALVLRTATVEGRAQAMRAAVGINAGCMLWGAAVAFGLGALLAVSEFAYSVLKFGGAAYLLYLGLGMLLRPRRSLAGDALQNESASNWFVKGLLGNALNPKVGIFYVSFLPQFIPHGERLVEWTFGLVGIHVLLGLAWSLVLIIATQSFGKVLRRDAVISWMDRTTGIIFMAFAAKLAFSRS
ncbi:LysE family translocator [Pseudomonas sp. SGAir0191]|uniref:LysE family translocator n=1 Tax=Pseudomonas putida group TaxID=136845 RepID=UPI000C2C7ED6|nr:LysE family translocator [Pseudomonas sp. SGAir0191]AUA35351.1 LysE family translocator [Pseudomonas sp. SGAir0191]